MIAPERAELETWKLKAQLAESAYAQVRKDSDFWFEAYKRECRAHIQTLGRWSQCLKLLAKES